MTVMYWAAVIIGALIVLWIIRKYAHTGPAVEGFGEQVPDPEEQVKSGNALESDYVEKLLERDGFPKSDAVLAIYLSSFSELVAYTIDGVDGKKISPPVFDGQSGDWRDFQSPDNKFRVSVVDTNVGVIPNSIKERNKDGTPIDIGLSLQALRLIGPSSRALGKQIAMTSAYALTDFTATFFGIIQTVQFAEGETRKVLFRVTAENPNLIEIAVRKRDNKNVLIEVILGDSGRAFQWVVDKYMLMSNRLPTLYALTYDKGSKTDTVRNPSITLYIGKTKLQKVFTHSDAPQEIRLGNSEIIVNPEGLFDMKLLAFAYFKTALDVKAVDDLNKYFNQQQSGINVFLSKQEEYTALTAELYKKLASANRTLDDAEDELKKCKEAAEAALAGSPKLRKWQVSLDETGAAAATAQLNDEDLKKCAPLALASKLAKKAANASAPSLPNVGKPNTNPNPNVKPAPFKKLTLTEGTESSAPKLNDPPASLSDPSASIWERMNDVLK